MGRFIVHLINDGFSPKNAQELLLKARDLAGDGAIVRDARVSSRYLEFDITVDGEELRGLLWQLSKISPVADAIEIFDKHMQKAVAVERAKFLFNEQRYWECHEVLEGVWKKESGDEKTLLQGLILTCAAFVHSQKDEDSICTAILRRSMEKLHNAIGSYYGIDLDRFKAKILEIMNTGEVKYFKI
jgi:hypothetical protein